MNKAVLTALIVTTAIVFTFIIFLCILATRREEEIPFSLITTPRLTSYDPNLPSPFTTALHTETICDQDKRNRPMISERQNDPPKQAEEPNDLETGSTSTTENSAILPSPTTPIPTTTIVATMVEIRTPISTRNLPFLSTTTAPIETPPPSPTEEDKIIFDNLTILLFELIITVYREHLRLRHYTR